MKVAKSIYSLSKAAEILGIEPEEILTYGASGKVEISVYIPDGHALWIEPLTPNGINKRQVDNTGFNSRHFPLLVRSKLTLLSLNKSDCQGILQMDGYRQHNFASGYRTKDYTKFVRVEPSNCLSNIYGRREKTASGMYVFVIETKTVVAEIMKRNPVFVLRLLSAPKLGRDSINQSIELSPRNLYVTVDQLQILLDELAKPPADTFRPQPYYSDMLVYLNQVAREMWGLAKQRNGKYPAPREVQEALGRKPGFNSENLRRYGAITIRPECADDNNASALLALGDKYRTKHFDALIAASDEHWRPIFQDSKSARTPKNITVELWLRGKPYHLKGAHARAAATIIRMNDSKGMECWQ